MWVWVRCDVGVRYYPLYSLVPGCSAWLLGLAAGPGCLAWLRLAAPGCALPPGSCIGPLGTRYRVWEGVLGPNFQWQAVSFLALLRDLPRPTGPGLAAGEVPNSRAAHTAISHDSLSLQETFKIRVVFIMQQHNVQFSCMTRRYFLAYSSI